MPDQPTTFEQLIAARQRLRRRLEALARWRALLSEEAAEERLIAHSLRVGARFTRRQRRQPKLAATPPATPP